LPRALRTLDRAIAISEGGAFDDEGRRPAHPEEEIAAGVAAALQWCVEPTDGMWPLVETGAVRIDAVDLAARGAGSVAGPRSWTVRSDHAAAAVRGGWPCRLPGHRPGCSRRDRGELRRGLAWAADPCAPMTGIPGVTWTCVEVVVEQVLARSR
jgi:hypothetical protein